MSTRRGFLEGIASTSAAGFVPAAIGSSLPTPTKQLVSPDAALNVTDPVFAAATPTSSDAVLGVQAGAIRSFPVAFTQSGIGAVARTPEDKMREVVSVLDFGANTIPGTTDMTAAFQSAINFAKSHSGQMSGGPGGSVFVPEGIYLITKSLDVTANNGVGHATRIYGGSSLNTVINTHLTEAYPVLDFCGNGYSRLEGISMRQKAGCMATSGVLYGYVGGDTVGMNGAMCDVLILMLTCPGIVNTTDQFIFQGVVSSGTYGCVSGAGNALGLRSKYVTILHTSDVTRTVFRDCNFQGGVPLMLTGCVEYDIQYVYLAPTFPKSPLPVNAALVIDTSYTALGVAQIFARGLRVENQAPTGTQDAIAAVAVLKRGGVKNTLVNRLEVEGALEVANLGGPNAGSSLIYSDVNSFISDLRVKGFTTYDTYPILNLTGSTALAISVGSVEIDMPLRTNLGTIAHKTNGRVQIAGSFPLSAISALSSGNPIGEQRRGSGLGEGYHFVSDFALHPRANSLVAQETAGIVLPATQNLAYAGGSGAQDLLSLAVPGGLYPTSGRGARHVQTLVHGSTSAACTATVRFTNGVNTTTSDAITFAANSHYVLRIHFIASSGGNLQMLVEMMQTGQPVYVWQGNSSLVVPSAAFSIKLAVTSANSNPLALFGITPTLLA